MELATGWSAKIRVIWNDEGEEYDENKDTNPNSEENTRNNDASSLNITPPPKHLREASASRKFKCDKCQEFVFPPNIFGCSYLFKAQHYR